MFYTKHPDNFAKIRIFNPLFSVRFKTATKEKKAGTCDGAGFHFRDPMRVRRRGIFSSQCVRAICSGGRNISLSSCNEFSRPQQWRLAMNGHEKRPLASLQTAFPHYPHTDKHLLFSASCSLSAYPITRTFGISYVMCTEKRCTRFSRIRFLAVEPPLPPSILVKNAG